MRIVRLADIVGRVRIDTRKLTHYALDPDSPYGRDKAVLFRRVLGFTRENYAGLLHQLETKCPQAEAAFHSTARIDSEYVTLSMCWWRG